MGGWVDGLLSSLAVQSHVLRRMATNWCALREPLSPLEWTAPYLPPGAWLPNSLESDCGPVGCWWLLTAAIMTHPARRTCPVPGTPPSPPAALSSAEEGTRGEGGDCRPCHSQPPARPCSPGGLGLSAAGSLLGTGVGSLQTAGGCPSLCVRIAPT